MMQSWNNEQVYFINKRLTKIKNIVKNKPQYTPRNVPKFYPKKYWVGVQWGQSYLMGRRCLFSLGWLPFTIKMPYGVDVLH